MPLNHIITKAELNPKRLFLIDGFGAILSAFLLGIVLVKFEMKFGIPSSTLYLLATIPIFFATYDFYCYYKTNQKTGFLLKVIAVLNFLYCCISLALVLYHYHTLTKLGWIYILIEIIIVLLLAIIEFIIGRKLIKVNIKRHA